MSETPNPDNVHNLHDNEAGSEADNTADAQQAAEDAARHAAAEEFQEAPAQAQQQAQAQAQQGGGQDVQALQAELDKTKDQMMRALADAENTRRRAQKDKLDAGNFAISNFAKDLLDFSDNFGRALASIPEDIAETDDRVKSVVQGIQAMEKELLRTFEKHGIQKIEPLEEIFDPNFHEVMFEIPGSGKPGGTILQVLEPGYLLKERLLRPARVGVAADDGSGSAPQEPGINLDQEV